MKNQYENVPCCKHGHAFTWDNTRIRERVTSTGKKYVERVCIRCNTLEMRARRARKETRPHDLEESRNPS